MKKLKSSYTVLAGVLFPYMWNRTNTPDAFYLQHEDGEVYPINGDHALEKMKTLSYQSVIAAGRIEVVDSREIFLIKHIVGVEFNSGDQDFEDGLDRYDNLSQSIVA